MKADIEKAIRKAVNRHLVQHVNVLPDRRCRVDIMIEEATNEILKLCDNNKNNSGKNN